MRKEWGVPDEEGLLPFTGFVNKVRDGLDALPADLESGITMTPSTFGISVGHRMSKATPLLRVSLPPLPRLQAEVACSAQKMSEAGLIIDPVHDGVVEWAEFGVGPSCFFSRLDAGIIPGDAVFVRVPATEDGSEGGAAEWSRNVTSGVGQ